MVKKRTVLLLGAAGKIGIGFKKEYLRKKKYQKAYNLILGAHNKKLKDKDFKIRYFSLEDIESLKKAMKGVDVVINLAANPNVNAEFKDLIKPNLIGPYNILEAAKQMNCSRVILASSIHAVKGYDHGYEVKNTDVPRPTSFYGASKVFTESLCYTFSSEYGLSCLAIRIGAYVSDDEIRNVCFLRHDYNYVISQRDMAQLLHKCIVASKKVRYGILSGISKNKKRDLDLKYTKKLIGYIPKDDAYKLCKEIKSTFAK